MMPAATVRIEGCGPCAPDVHFNLQLDCYDRSLHGRTIKLYTEPPAEERVHLEGAIAVTDPHHNGSMEWTWINGRLYSRLRGTSHAWRLCKRVNATPARLRALASILPPDDEDVPR